MQSKRQAMIDELAMLARTLRGDYLAGTLSAADFALYPLVAFLYRVQEKRMPDLDADGMLSPAMAAWRTRMQALPFLDRTIPPHWTQG